MASIVLICHIGGINAIHLIAGIAHEPFSAHTKAVEFTDVAWSDDFLRSAFIAVNTVHVPFVILVSVVVLVAAGIIVFSVCPSNQSSSRMMCL